MTVTRKKPTGTIVLLGLAAALLGGCAAETAQDVNPFITGQWRQSPHKPEVRVEKVQMEHFVAFQPNAIRLDGAEQERMVQFIRDGRLNIRDRIYLSAPRGADGTYDSATAARLDVLKGEFQQLGLIAEVAQVSGAKGGGDQIAIVVQRAAVIPPDCSAPEEPWAGQRPHYEYGCAYNAAMGMMVADPHDLAKGRPMTHPDGEAAASAIQRYRVKKLNEKREFIKEGTGGGDK
jgi:pilus assembly protein CpaD